MKYTLTQLYQNCLRANYTHVEHDGDYALAREGDTLYLYLECTNGGADWANNFRFWAKPYKDMKIKWNCHKGFLTVWKSIEPYVEKALLNPEYKHIVIIGYSHGAALAGLAHEYVWFNRPDLREGDGLISYGFGAPRFYWGFKVKKSLRERWVNFHPVRNLDDIVTHAPPVIFGYRHVNELIIIGKKRQYNGVKAHYQSHYIEELTNYEQN